MGKMWLLRRKEEKKTYHKTIGGEVLLPDHSHIAKEIVVYHGNSIKIYSKVGRLM